MNLLNFWKTQSNFEEVLATEGISWKFIPVHAPHFGGLWEAGVKQTKNHLKKLVRNINLTYEELNTTFMPNRSYPKFPPLNPPYHQILMISVLSLLVIF